MWWCQNWTFSRRTFPIRLLTSWYDLTLALVDKDITIEHLGYSIAIENEAVTDSQLWHVYSPIYSAGCDMGMLCLFPAWCDLSTVLVQWSYQHFSWLHQYTSVTSLPFAVFSHTFPWSSPHFAGRASPWALGHLRLRVWAAEDQHPRTPWGDAWRIPKNHGVSQLKWLKWLKWSNFGWFEVSPCQETSIWPVKMGAWSSKNGESTQINMGTAAKMVV